MFGRRKAAPETHPDDISVYEPVKRLGIFALQEVDPDTKDGATLARMYQKANVIKDARRPFIDLHLRPEASLRGVGSQAIRHSLGMVADYVAAHPDKLAGQDVVGVTYPKLGQLATRLGFQTHEVDGDTLPQALAAKINEIADPYGHASTATGPTEVARFEDGTINYSALGDSDTKMFGEFAAVSQSSDDLIERFGSQNEQ